ncbi:MAG: phosphoribosylanthranilate isomerase [Planctomycetaceae bacterium]|nr:phosphoribosylanthranilate isomerase [Planctomycetaceae bacterium]
MSGNKTKLKICGITSPEDAVAVLEAGADFVGIVHYPKSPRHCTTEKISEILDAAEPLPDKETVLVVADAGVDEVEKILDAANNRFGNVQIHRDLTDDEFAEFHYRLNGRTNLIRVLRNIDKMQDIVDGIIENGEVSTPQLYLLEMSHGKLPGGNGTKWDWTLAKKFCRKYPAFIAGGIETEDICGIIKEVMPFGIDLSSGVERTPGIKSIEKVREVVSKISLF